MPVWDRQGETVEVWPPIITKDEWGNDVIAVGDTSLPPELVHRCIVQPVTEDSDLSQGYGLISVYRIICPSWPHPAKTVVRWRDQIWDQRSNATRRPYTVTTSHDTVFIRAREEEDHAPIRGW